jgi:pyrimidine operon attenuation protein / uracil phosphoribosyltransferase
MTSRPRLREKAQVLDDAALDRALTRIAHEILERNGGAKDLAFVGLRTRGVTLAQRLQAKIAAIDGAQLPVGTLDITLYRDDLSTVGPKPVVQPSKMEIDIVDKDIVLCDDVLYTGRTVRAALDALFDHGRPRRVQLLVLIDRGHRELPVEATFVGRRVQTSDLEIIEVKLQETDNLEKVLLVERDANA